jgi:hypothetical protein
MKTKSQKQAERRRKIEHTRNVELNKPKPKFILHVKVPGGWKAAMKFWTMQQVDQHIANIEDLRKRNASDIVEAVIVEAKSGKRLKHIEGHAMQDPALQKPTDGKPEGVTGPVEEKVPVEEPKAV